MDLPPAAAEHLHRLVLGRRGRQDGFKERTAREVHVRQLRVAHRTRPVERAEGEEVGEEELAEVEGLDVVAGEAPAGHRHPELRRGAR